tara:strand:- start:213 stop:386 length:174 start_codon:yes stop_codon:yes gene_type:complete
MDSPKARIMVEAVRLLTGFTKTGSRHRVTERPLLNRESLITPTLLNKLFIPGGVVAE